MTLRLDLAPSTERRLTELAAKTGATLEAYAKLVLEREAHCAVVVTCQIECIRERSKRRHFEHRTSRVQR